MNGDESQLKITVTAVDNASATLKNVAANASEATGQIADTAEKAGGSFEHLSEHVVEAVSVYELFHIAQDAIKEVILGSIEASMQESATMVQVAVDVKNAGLSYSALAPEIAGVAEQNMRLGFTQQDTQLSMGKAILATGNYNDALKLNHLAMDLSVAKGIDLNSATVLLQQAMAGNTRVLKQYGISIDSAASSADVLNTIQEKVGGSADALAGTPLGHMKEVQAEWEQIQVEIGEKLMPVVEELFKIFNDNLPLLEQGANAVGTVIDGVAKTANALATPARIVGEGLGNLINQAQGLPMVWSTFDQITNGAAVGGPAAAKGVDALAKSTATAKTNFNDFANEIHAADNAVLKHSDAIGKLSADYDKMKTAGATNLAELADSFVTKMTTINDAIDKTKQSIADLTASYAATQASDTKSVAENIVASETKIADLKTKLAASTSQSETDSLNKQLADEQKNYDSSLAFRTANVAAITAAEARAKETDLQRTIDDYTAKQALDLDDYNKKLANLKKELLDKQNEAATELTLYTTKTAQINKILDAGNTYFNTLSASRLSTTTKEVDAEIAKFQALAAAIAQTKSASATAVGTVNIPSLPHHEAGGFVNAPRGTAVPIIAHGGEEIIPAEQAGSRGGATISVTINNPSVRSSSDLDAMRRMIDEVMRPVLLNAKIAHV